MTRAIPLLISLAVLGCSEPPAGGNAPKSGGSILKKTTQDIGEFDPNAGAEVSNSKVKVTNPLLGALEAYGPIMEQVAKLGIDKQVATFYAIEGRYPKDHDEFMEKIVKKNNLKLPVLPGGSKYQYDVENHKLIVVKAE